MATSSSTSYLLSAADVSWGRRESSCVTIDVAAASLDGVYFEVDAPASDFGSNGEFYVWFDLDASSVDPAPAGRTAIEVDILTADTAAQIATKLQTAVEANANFRSKVDSVDTTQVEIMSEYKGAVTQRLTDVDTTLTITALVLGAGGDLGKTSGGVEIAMESTSSQVLSDQTGQLVLDDVVTGQTVEVTMSLLEMTADNWSRVVGTVTGSDLTPGGGTKLTGFGEDRLYASLFDLGGELVLHPTRLASTDRSKNITLWKSAPKPGSVNFSGEEPQLMEVAFTALLDSATNTAINLMAFGDNEQDVRA